MTPLTLPSAFRLTKYECLPIRLSSSTPWIMFVFRYIKNVLSIIYIQLSILPKSNWSKLLIFIHSFSSTEILLFITRWEKSKHYTWTGIVCCFTEITVTSKSPSLFFKAPSLFSLHSKMDENLILFHSFDRYYFIYLVENLVVWKFLFLSFVTYC